MKKKVTSEEKKQIKKAIRLRLSIWVSACLVCLVGCALLIQFGFLEPTEKATEDNTFETELIATHIEGVTFIAKGGDDQFLLIYTEDDAYFIEWVNAGHHPLGNDTLQQYVDLLKQEEKLYAQVYCKKKHFSSKYPAMWEIVALRGEETEYYLLEYYNDTQKSERFIASVFAAIFVGFSCVGLFALYDFILGDYEGRVNKKIIKKFKKLFKNTVGLLARKRNTNTGDG